MTELLSPPDHAIAKAVEMARKSPCLKSKRGVVIFHPLTDDVLCGGFNTPPRDFRSDLRPRCDGSEACRASCAKTCIHAESKAIRGMIWLCGAAREHSDPAPAELDLLHVKIDIRAGDLVAGGGPSCWQCSREILDVGLGGVWLFETVERATGTRDQPPPVWKRYTAAEFHAETLRFLKLHHPKD